MHNLATSETYYIFLIKSLIIKMFKGTDHALQYLEDKYPWNWMLAVNLWHIQSNIEEDIKIYNLTEYMSEFKPLTLLLLDLTLFELDENNVKIL